MQRNFRNIFRIRIATMLKYFADFSKVSDGKHVKRSTM